jgi:hypothetical protein
MKRSKSLIMAVLATLASGAAVWAADPPTTSTPPSTVYADGSTPTTLTPAMYLLDKTSFGKWLESENISIGGFAEGGYFYDTSNPHMGANAHGDSPTLIGFPGGYSNRFQLDQLDMMFQKTVDTTKPWDIGFQFEQGYGTDDAQIHSDGLVDNRAPATLYNKYNTNPGAGFPRNQYDIVQANVTLEAFGSANQPGMTIEAGKFVTLFGYETINPTGNAFYTHSYLFTDGIPLTQTGILGSYTFPNIFKGVTITGGATRGWNESTNDNNGEVDFLGEIKTTLTDKAGLTFNIGEGPESYGAPISDLSSKYGGAGDPATFKGDSNNYWTVLELEPTYTVSDQLTLAADMLYVDFPHGALTDTETDTLGNVVPKGDAAQWYAVAAYAAYKVCPEATINTRVEWYRDQGGFSVGAASGPVSANYYEATVGVQVHPFPTNDILQWLQIRPEVRYDWSDRPVYNASHTSAIGGVGDYSEFTVAMDVIMQY